MTRGGGAGAEEEPAAAFRLKFLCSYGGKILPRPSDGKLKYVGGETRILSVPRAITFKELKEKISAMFNKSDVVIKYQVFPEDLDALVSVRSDEDLTHMLDEYDRHESMARSPSSSSRFRIFLFRCSNVATSVSTSPTYIDAINGGGSVFSIPIPSRPPMFAISSSSVGSSPDSSPVNRSGPLAPPMKSGGRLGMARVRSTPNLSGGLLSSTAGSPPKGSGGGGGGGLFSPFHHHPPPYYQYPHQQQPIPQHKGMMSRMGCGAQRNDMCGGGYGCGCVFSGYQNQRRYNYPPSAAGGGGGRGRFLDGEDLARRLQWSQESACRAKEEHLGMNKR